MRDCIRAIRQVVRIPGALSMAVMPSRQPAALAAGPVGALHIGSLVDFMEQGLAAREPKLTCDANHVPANIPALVETAK